MEKKINNLRSKIVSLNGYFVYRVKKMKTKDFQTVHWGKRQKIVHKIK